MTDDSSPERMDAAVLVPVFRDADGRLRLVLVRRADRGLHAGQIAFPGGKRESADGSPLETALREAEEEIGLCRESVEVLAPLAVVETMTTRFRVFPFLARVRRQPWRVDPRELVEVLEVPVEDLLQPGAQGEETKDFPTWPQPRRVPFLRVGDRQLWGATYRILRPLLPRLVAGEWPL